MTTLFKVIYFKFYKIIRYTSIHERCTILHEEKPAKTIMYLSKENGNRYFLISINLLLAISD